jgi:butyryl-CoA dehydrogenase
MNFELTEEQKMIREMVADFADNELKPIAAEIDEKQEIPAAIYKKVGELGLMGMLIPEEYGGSATDAICYAIAIEELSRGCASTGVMVAVQNSLVDELVYKFGSDEQKQEFLIPLAKGEKLGAFSLTEPDAGSDAGAVKLAAKDDGDNYVLNGTKTFCTNGKSADICLVFATRDRELKHKGIICLIVEKGTPGFSVGKVEHKLGIRGSETVELVFEDCKVPKANRLGGEDEGFKMAMYSLDSGRISISAQAIGIARAAFDEALEYTKNRKQFGTRICDFQYNQFKMADMATMIEAAQLLNYRAAYLKMQGVRHTKESAMSKLFSATVANDITRQALQLHGGYGYITEYPVERHFRDAKITEIYEGTSEIQQLVIASTLLKE